MSFWRRYLAAGDIFVDVGANVGAYSLWAADRGAEVLAIEPDPTTARRLRENVALSDLQVDVYECALASSTGTMRLTADLDCKNHLVFGSEGLLVPVRTLDEILGARHAAGVKIDVEGAERLVLEGATRALRESRLGIIQLEWNSLSEETLGEGREPLEAILRSHGYEFFVATLEGSLRHADVSGFEADVFAVAPKAVEHLKQATALLAQ